MVPQPSTKLASLKQGLAGSARISIHHQATQDSELKVLFASFPKDLAVAMSPYMARALNAVPLNQVSVADLKPKNSTTVTIRGGLLEAHTEVLQWILNCGEAGKTINYRAGYFTGFSDYAMMVLSCETLGVPYLRTQLMARMENIAAIQVHSVEVAKIFTTIQGPHKIKQMCCESIATAMWEDRCLASRKYNDLCEQEEFKEFNDGLDAHYRSLEHAYYKTPEGKADLATQKEKESRRERRKQADAERHERYVKNKEQNLKEKVARLHNAAPEDVTVQKDGNISLSIEAERVRKSQAGRSGYVRLDLGKIGVTPGAFRAKDTWSSNRQNKNHKNTDSDKKAVADKPEASSNNTQSEQPADVTTVGDLCQKFDGATLDDAQF
jgi:hypothetical protein